MNWFLTEEQNSLQGRVRGFAEQHILPIKVQLDREAIFPRDLIKALGEAGLAGIHIPQKYGGGGGGLLELCLVIEELAKIEAGVAATLLGNAVGSGAIVIAGSESQRRKYLPPIAAGEHLCAEAMYEPQAGRDVGKMKTVVTKTGSEYLIEGKKEWVLNAGEAETYIILARTGEDRSSEQCEAFIVEKEILGLSFGDQQEKMGMRSAVLRDLILERCRLDSENILMDEANCPVHLNQTSNVGLVGAGALAVGISHGALNLALNYSQERKQFGVPIGSFEAIRSMLAEMSTQTEAARSLVYEGARMIDSGKADCDKQAAMCKLFASEVAMKVTTDAVQIYGGYGFMRDFPVEKYMRDAKMTQVYAGANEHQRLIIGDILTREMNGS